MREGTAVRFRRGLALTVAVLGAVACGRTLGFGDREEGPGGDGGVALDAARADARVGGPDAGAADAFAPADAGREICGCSDSEPVYLFGECIPPLQMGCPAAPCVPGGSDCGPGYSCLSCGAAACCHCAACRPTCVFTGPAQGPLPEYLKIQPTTGAALQDATIRIEGFPFYVGALFYLARVGSSGDLHQVAGTSCSLEVRAPGQPVGTVPVWVSQYGGGAPWVLAGFFTFSRGDAPICVQPGYPCSGTAAPCCESADVPMACSSGRCLRR